MGQSEASPSRIASDPCPGCHHLGGMGITRQNRYWHAHCWIVHLERAIVEHRTAIDNAGSIKVQPGYEPVAETKHRADERLCGALKPTHAFSHHAYGDALRVRHFGSHEPIRKLAMAALVFIQCARERGHDGMHLAHGWKPWKDNDDA